MKKESSYNLKVGIFVVVGLALFTIGIFLLGRQKNIFGNNFSLKAIFHNVGGLQVGNNIRFTGINVGTVDNIEIKNDTSVIVYMSIRGNVKKFIKKDSKAVIGSEGLMGDKLINITAGEAKQIVSEGDYITTTKPVDTDEILNSLKITTENAALITTDMAEVMNSIRKGKGTLGVLLKDSTFAKNIKQAMVSVKQSASGLNENMEAAKHSFLLKGYFKKKDKAAKDKVEKDQEIKDQQLKDQQKNKK